MKKRTLSGFTLVEVMVSLVILVILISAASAIMITEMNLFAKNSFMRAAQTDGNNIYSIISDKLLYATDITVAPISSDISEERKYTEQLIVNGNKLTLKTKVSTLNIYDEDMLHGNKFYVRFGEFNKTTDKSIPLTVIIKRDGKVIYEKNGIVPLLNYNYSEKKYEINCKEGNMYITCSYLC